MGWIMLWEAESCNGFGGRSFPLGGPLGKGSPVGEVSLKTLQQHPGIIGKHVQFPAGRALLG